MRNNDALLARHESHYSVNAQNSVYFRLKRTLRVQVVFVSVRICSLSFDWRCDLSWKLARKKVTFILCHSFRLQTCE